MLRHIQESTLPEDQCEELNIILAWLAHAIRPLRLGKADELLKMKSPAGYQTPGLERTLRETSASFFNLI